MKALLTDIDALLVTNPTNIRYLTGFVGASPEEREAYLLVTPKKNQLFLTPLYREEGKKFDAIEISREHPIEKALTRLDPVKLGFEADNLTVAEYEKLKKELKGVTLVATRGRIENERMIKRPDEIANVRLAAKLTDQCFAYITRRIRPGMTEGRVAFEIEAFIRSRGAQLAFTPIVAFNEHSSQPHYHDKSHDPLRRGSLILLDFGARVNGYCADMTRVVFLGKPKDEWVSAYNAVLRAQQASLTYLTGPDPVRSGAAADRAAREEMKKAKLPDYPHGLGHGVGLEIHEAPRLTVKKDAELTAGMVVTVEPGVYMAGSYGVRIEDLVLLKKNGIEILTRSSKELITL
jgi:Xaa-Pro aminopeptidase